MQEKLRELRTTNNPFWIELNVVPNRHPRPVVVGNVAKDIVPNHEDDDSLDDSDISLCDVVKTTHKKPVDNKRCGRITAGENGGLTTVTDAKSLDQVPKPLEGEEGKEGRGRRKKTANRLYHLSDFARHWDNDGSDIE
jgi:hypothetical protein